MRYLLDTHIVLWIFNEPRKLPPTTRNILENPANNLTVGILSAWEIAIKLSIGKVKFPGGVSAFIQTIQRSGLELLTIMPSHVEMVEKLPFIHRDPFDRLLVATALCEKMTIITADENIHQYAIPWTC